MNTGDGSLVGAIEITSVSHQEDSPARSIAFSPDGKYLMLSAPMHSIAVIDLPSRSVLTSLEGHKHHVSTLAFFRDGTRMLSGGFDGKLCLWSVPDFKLVKSLDHARNGSVTKDEMIVAIALGSDDEYIAVGFMNGSVGMYESTFTQPISTFSAHQEFLLNVVISDQDVIATASHDKTAKLWTLRGVASCKQVLRGHTDFVLAIAFAPNDPIVFTGSKDESIKCWHQKTGENLFTVTAHKNTVFQIDPHPTERKILSCSGDGLVCLWEYFLS
jgi:WD40 repeat protein